MAREIKFKQSTRVTILTTIFFFAAIMGEFSPGIAQAALVATPENQYPQTTANTQAFVYNAANQLLEDDTYIYSYDKNGNTISKTNKTSNEYTRFIWNAEGQLVEIQKFAQAGDANPTLSAKYIYDGMGRRVAKIVNGVVTKYLYDKEDILLEMDADDNIIARYTHGPRN